MSRQRFDLGKIIRIDVLNSILKQPPPAASPGTEVQAPLKSVFRACLSRDLHFWEKSFKQKLFLVKFPID